MTWNVSTAFVEDLLRLNVRRLDMLGPESHAHHPCGDAAEDRREQDDQLAHGPGEGEGLSSAAEHAAVDEDLGPLDAADGHLAALLHGAEIVLGDGSLLELGGEEVGGRHGVLDREVDADAAGGGHGVGGVADAEEPWTVPVAEA